MTNIRKCVALAALALALFMSSPSGARADQTGDDDFCLGGWFFVPVNTVAFVTFLGYPIPYLTGAHWSCRSD